MQLERLADTSQRVYPSASVLAMVESADVRLKLLSTMSLDFGEIIMTRSADQLVERARSSDAKKRPYSHVIVEDDANGESALKLCKAVRALPAYTDTPMVVVAGAPEPKCIADARAMDVKIVPLGQRDEMRSAICEAVRSYHGPDVRAHPASKKFNHGRVLAVDDSKTTRLLLDLALTEDFEHVMVVDAADTAFDVAKRSLAAGNPFTHFVLDIEMGPYDGVELARKIRSIPAFHTAPIIFLTGSNDPERLHEAETVGTGVVNKASVKELREGIRLVVQKILKGVPAAALWASTLQPS